MLHPGQVLKDEFLAAVGISAAQLAERIGVSATAVEDVISGDAPLRAELALRLARFFQTSSQFWMELQSDYELEQARAASAGALDGIRPFAAATEAVSQSR